MSIDNVNVEIDPCQLNGSSKDSPCNGFRVSLFVDDNLIASGMAPTAMEAAQWCAHNVRRTSMRALEALRVMGFPTETPQAYIDKLKAKEKP